VEQPEHIDARKAKYGAKEALAIAKDASEVLVVRGKKLIRYDITSGAVPDGEILSTILGRSGTLRAPTIRVGKRVVVGFHPDAYTEALDL